MERSCAYFVPHPHLLEPLFALMPLFILSRFIRFMFKNRPCLVMNKWYAVLQYSVALVRHRDKKGLNRVLFRPGTRGEQL